MTINTTKIHSKISINIYSSHLKSLQKTQQPRNEGYEAKQKLRQTLLP